MAFNSLFNLLLLDPNIPLCNCRTAVLQELLDQGNIVAAVLVDLCSVIFAEAVSAYAGDAQVVADEFELLLDCPLSQWEDHSVREPRKDCVKEKKTSFQSRMGAGKQLD